MSSSNAKKHTTKNPIRRFFIKNFLATLGKKVIKLNPINILDIGCGEGFVIKHIKGILPGVIFTGVDISSKAIEEAKNEMPDASFYNIDLSKKIDIETSFLKENFDLVICLEVLEHIDNYQQAIENIKKINSRYFIFSVPNEPFFRLGNLVALKNVKLLGNDPEHVNNWTFVSFKKLIGEHFEIMSLSYPFPWQMLICKKKEN